MLKMPIQLGSAAHRNYRRYLPNSRLRKIQIKRTAFRTHGIKQNACRLTHPQAASASACRIRTYGILA